MLFSAFLIPGYASLRRLFRLFLYIRFRIMFGIFFFLDLLLWGEQSSAAVPFTTLLALLFLWYACTATTKKSSGEFRGVILRFGISVPLTFVGSYIGFKKQVRTQEILLRIQTPQLFSSRSQFPLELIRFLGKYPIRYAISHKVWVSLFDRLATVHSSCTGHHNGRCSAIWLHFHSVLFYFQQHMVSRDCSLAFVNYSRLSASRSHQIYYMFGFLFVIVLILLITCSETAILLCYFHLCAEVRHRLS